MTLIPTASLTVWRTRARRNNLSELNSLIEFRELCKSEGFKEERVLGQAQKEAAEAMMMAPETLRDKMAKIREHSREQLIYWLSNGLSFDHLETANRLAEVAKKTPLKLLNEAIDPGNATGETMTVKELEAFALGEIQPNNKPQVYRLVVMFEKLGKFPKTYGWDTIKTARFTDWLELGKEFLS